MTTKKAVLLYYSIIGLDLDEIKNLQTDYNDLNQLYPYEYKLPKSSQTLSLEFLKIMTKFGENFEDDEYSQIQKDKYLESVLEIINASTSLNLLEASDENCELHFERLNRILFIALKTINNMQIEEVIDFADLIKKQDSKRIFDTIKEYNELSLLVYLGMNPNNDIEDYKMFESDTSSFVSPIKLINLITDNYYSKTDYKANNNPFRRVSYQKTIGNK